MSYLNNMQHFFKIILAVFLFFITLSSSIHSKPIPPGSGKGDVPANILILLDSSVSMRNPVVGGTGIKGIDWAVELDDGNFIVSEHNRGLFKYLVADEKRDTDFAGGQPSVTNYADEITGLIPFRDQLILFTRQAIFKITGTTGQFKSAEITVFLTLWRPSSKKCVI